jgi:hypothetical protein
MSKKLIAVASAAALALAGLVAIPTAANAVVGPFAVTADGAVTNHTTRDGSTAAKSLQINVPTADVLRFTASSIAVGKNYGPSAIKLTITTPGATDAITVSATGGVEVITDTVFDDGDATTATGTTTLTDVAADGSAVIYAYTTSTAAGTVVVSAGGSSKTFHISGLSEFVYNLALTAPSSAAISGDVTITGTAKDMFGNNLTTSVPEASWTVTGLGGNLSGSLSDTFTYDATAKTYKMVVANRSTAGSAAFSVSLAAAVSAAKVTAFGTPVQTAFFSVNAADLSAQVTALTAQVAALTADYNALAAKWNKRVASKTAPKKKVATK